MDIPAGSIGEAAEHSSDGMKNLSKFLTYMDDPLLALLRVHQLNQHVKMHELKKQDIINNRKTEMNKNAFVMGYMEKEAIVGYGLSRQEKKSMEKEALDRQTKLNYIIKRTKDLGVTEASPDILGRSQHTFAPLKSNILNEAVHGALFNPPEMSREMFEKATPTKKMAAGDMSRISRKSPALIDPAAKWLSGRSSSARRSKDMDLGTKLIQKLLKLKK